MHRLDLKLLALFILLPLQVLLVVFYVLSTPTSFQLRRPVHKVRFSDIKLKENQYSNYENDIHAHDFCVNLNDSLVKNYYTAYNGIFCYNNGTEEYGEHLLHNRYSKKCSCKKGWHGKDCSQPEVIWRAFVTSRQEIMPKKRQYLRRIVYACHLTNSSIHSLLLETVFHELNHVVDLFIVYETTVTRQDASFFFQQLERKVYSSLRYKIIYISIDGNKLYSGLWQNMKRVITNLRQDDVIVIMNGDQIPNPKALFYFKVYDGWPQPVGFRLRWSVYGFFWQHPKLTNTIYQAAFTIQYFEDVMLHKRFEVHYDSLQTENQLIVGDLNHYGGWYCNFCLEPKDIIASLYSGSLTRPINWDQMKSKKIDEQFIQELIRNGLWLDSATALVSKKENNDQYFAPHYILNNSWQYDSLINNFYAYDYN